MYGKVRSSLSLEPFNIPRGFPCATTTKTCCYLIQSPLVCRLSKGCLENAARTMRFGGEGAVGWGAALRFRAPNGVTLIIGYCRTLSTRLDLSQSMTHRRCPGEGRAVEDINSRSFGRKDERHSSGIRADLRCGSCRCFDVLWHQPARPIPARCDLRPQDPLGTKPADVPVEKSITFGTGDQRQTRAQALGLSFPQSILFHVDEFIEEACEKAGVRPSARAVMRYRRWGPSQGSRLARTKRRPLTRLRWNRYRVSRTLPRGSSGD
jgi:hypothetical protein